MKQFLVALLLIVFFSCGQEKSIQLPEIQNAKITEVKDVSPAYIFYDETKPDSVELNRKNLIISTNWLVNVDKQLTLKQAIPSIIKLQDKKRNATMHKNEKARNYYTCNDTSIKNLGFIDFTDVVYKTLEDSINEEIRTSENVNEVFIIVTSLDEIVVNSSITFSDTKINTLTNELKSQLDTIELYNVNNEEDLIFINLSLSENLSFQDYISIKSKLIDFKKENVVIRDREYIY